jgi:hypothetical protein
MSRKNSNQPGIVDGRETTRRVPIEGELLHATKKERAGVSSSERGAAPTPENETASDSPPGRRGIPLDSDSRE